jgi:hypothetical protein
MAKRSNTTEQEEEQVVADEPVVIESSVESHPSTDFVQTPVLLPLYSNLMDRGYQLTRAGHFYQKKVQEMMRSLGKKRY